MTFNGVIVDSRPIPPNHCLRWQGCVLSSSPHLRDALWVFSWQRCPCFQLLLSGSGGKNVVLKLYRRIRDLYVDCFWLIQFQGRRRSSSISLKERALPSPSGRYRWKSDLNRASLHLLVKAEQTIKPRNSFVSIYRASESSGARSWAENIASLWNVLFIRICSVARRFIFTHHLPGWFEIVEPSCYLY